jgi:hypothetical protein
MSQTKWIKRVRPQRNRENHSSLLENFETERMACKSTDPGTNPRLIMASSSLSSSSSSSITACQSTSSIDISTFSSFTSAASTSSIIIPDSAVHISHRVGTGGSIKLLRNFTSIRERLSASSHGRPRDPSYIALQNDESSELFAEEKRDSVGPFPVRKALPRPSVVTNNIHQTQLCLEDIDTSLSEISTINDSSMNDDSSSCSSLPTGYVRRRKGLRTVRTRSCRMQHRRTMAGQQQQQQQQQQQSNMVHDAHYGGAHASHLHDADPIDDLLGQIDMSEWLKYEYE